MQNDSFILEQIKSYCISSKLTIGTVESITCGRLCSKLGDIPGASQYLRGSIVAYQNLAKIDILKIPKQLIEKYSPVSPQIAQQMALCGKEILKTDITISTTGYAGPQQNNEPVGLVYICISLIKNKLILNEFHYSGNRIEIQEQTVSSALNMLWDSLKKS